MPDATTPLFPDKIILADHSDSLTEAWSECFSVHKHVEVHAGDFFARDAHAMVSPANSFGIMDGGLDAAISAELGGGIQSTVQDIILEKHHGELPIGYAEVVPTRHARWPFLVVAPTMRIPENVANTLNAYLAFRAILLAVIRHNQTNEDRRISSLLVPGLATGIGAMDAQRCAAQMRIAHDQVFKPARIPSFAMIHEIHRKLRFSI